MTQTSQVVASRSAGQRNVDHFRGALPLQTHSVEQVNDVLRTLPSHGWTAGWIGRRDRALLVLSQLAGLTYGQIAALTADDVIVDGGFARIKTAGGVTKLGFVEDNLLCGPCGLARWVHALDLTVVYPDGRVIAALIARAVPLTSDSPHLCQSNNSITEPVRRFALLPPIDQWGHSIRMAIEPRRTTRAGISSGGAPAGQPPADVGRRAQLLEQRVERLLDPGFACTRDCVGSEPYQRGWMSARSRRS